MGAVQSAEERRQELTIQLEELLQELEELIAGVREKPTKAEIARWYTKEVRFKPLFKELVELPNAHYAADGMLTRFSRLAQAWARKERPESYIYSVS